MGQRYELSSFIDRILSDTHDFGLLGSRTVQYYKLKKLLDLVGMRNWGVWTLTAEFVNSWLVRSQPNWSSAKVFDQTRKIFGPYFLHTPYLIYSVF